MTDRPPGFYLVCATPRSGSALLCDGLWRTGVAGQPDEHFLPQNLEARGWPPEDPRRFFLDVFNETATPNGSAGVKVMWSSMERVASELDPRGKPDVAAFADKLPPLQYIWIARRDKVGQAVSLAKATQTGVWSAVQGTRAADGTPHFCLDEIDDYVRLLKSHDASWKRFFLSRRASPLKIAYEDLAARYEATMHRVLAFLGVAVASLPAPRPKRQADAVSEDWVARYRNRGPRDRARLMLRRKRGEPSRSI